MKVNYREPDIYERLEQARTQAKKEGRLIKSFSITEAEFEEFIRIASDLDSKSFFAGYTVQHYNDGRPSAYYYKDIPVIVEKNNVKQI